jgi:hypothetical protein
MDARPVIDAATLQGAGPDPLGILSSCAVVVNASALVAIDRNAVDVLATRIVGDHVPPPLWDDELHYRGAGLDAVERTAGWVFALDTLNFCFWAQEQDPTWRWRIASDGATHDGYMALARALRDATRSGVPVWDPTWQANVDEGVMARIFTPAPGSASIPLLPERVANLRELGTAMLRLEPGENPFTRFIARAGGSAPALVQAVVETFPSFNDIAIWNPGDGTPAQEIRFHKRAQILVSDLAGALGGDLLLRDVGYLTAFADYKVPQVLRELGILRYHDDLAGAIHRRELIPPGSREEIEIRAATIWGCELLRQALAHQGRDFTAAEVDWLLWNQGQRLPETTEPYHRTRTIYY